MNKLIKSIYQTAFSCLATAALAVFLTACQPPQNNTVSQNAANAAPTANENARQPSIEVAPVENGEGNYKILTGNSLQLTIRAAAAAQTAEVFYQPVTASDRSLKLRTLNAQNNNEFAAELKVPEDLNGEIWARVRYADGENRETARLLLAKRVASETDSNSTQPTNVNQQLQNQQTTASDTDESARGDKFTKGKIQRAALQPGNGNVRVTVNVPSFTLTLWQNDKEIEKYYVGVGRKQFPIPIGLRTADKIILNPNWIPPDSEWVRESNVEPYEKIPADDPNNPLGKIKFPLGDAYLLHEAQAPTDIGNLVSHGCVRIMRDDIFDLTKKIVAARGLNISGKEIEAARTNAERKVLDLNGEIPVDINYDTIIVENGTLRIYPDVYERNANTIENLRAELADNGVDAAKADDKTLREMLDKVNDEQYFAVSLADIKAGNLIANGKTEPLTPQQAKR